jgi:hypothetical protein
VPGEQASRNDGVTIRQPTATTKTCPSCARTFEPSGRRRHCSDACRQAAWRRRHAPELPKTPVPLKGRKREMTVYECDSCGGRELGVQRCEACNSWMRAVGIGNNSPCCGEPYSIGEFMEEGG